MCLTGAVSSTVNETVGTSEGKLNLHYFSKSGLKAHDDCWLIGQEYNGHNTTQCAKNIRCI